MESKITLDNVLILDFWKVLKSGDYSIIGATEDEWNALYDDYFKQKNDSQSKHYLKVLKDEAVLLYKIELAKQNYEFFQWLIKNKPFFVGNYEQRLEEIYQLIEVANKTTMKRDKDEAYNLKTLERVYNSLINTYNLKQTQKKKKEEEQIQNIYKVVANVSRVLEIQLQVNQMTVSEWLAYEEMAKEKSKQLKQANGRSIHKR